MSPNPDSRLPFPSWEGLGVGSDSLLPTPYSLYINDSYRTPNYFQPLSRARKD
ncbi:hypothetical protein [Moorena sp. SIO3I6]|uniref:hypothetical protein n=1 Tax=Moorena sp. SIO3I6 TaxID=2607831 RepID=UPI0013F933F5|nr:hypothetical protein [Moorena sp. SIO3I6]NEP20678.1 hypothetical protein [Moorena sp. SIO3I6]